MVRGLYPHTRGQLKKKQSEIQNFNLIHAAATDDDARESPFCDFEFKNKR
jgi:hypothetical protein